MGMPDLLTIASVDSLMVPTLHLDKDVHSSFTAQGKRLCRKGGAVSANKVGITYLSLLILYQAKANLSLIFTSSNATL
jgi:hypothetical protein